MASKRRLRRKSCEGKVRYQTPQIAMSVLFRLKRQKKLNGVLNTYKCKFCGKFHLGHAPGFVQRKMGY